MSIESSRDALARDPRTVLVREKYFSLRPKPLERWLWQQGLSQAAERVFWLHWEEGSDASTTHQMKRPLAGPFRFLGLSNEYVTNRRT